MSAPALRTLRYARSWILGRDDVRSEEIVLERAGTPVPATLLMRRGSSGPLPAWVVLHGITRPGRAHRQLVRFTRALAEGGCAVLVPEVPEWRELDLAPSLTVPTILASLEALGTRPSMVAPGPVGLLGFSFGAPQALTAAADPRLEGRLAGVAGFGGYCDLERTIVFQFTGTHEYGGERHHLRPDPYGRWIVGANYLTRVPGMEDAEPVARTLHALAAEAGDVGAIAWDPRYDPSKERLRATLSRRHRELFDLFAPPDGGEPPPSAGEELGHQLARAAREAAPELEPAPRLGSVTVPVHLLHGRHDHLIPFTEMLRLRDALPGNALARSTVTRLFAHSSQDRLPGPAESIREVRSFLGALNAMLNLV